MTSRGEPIAIVGLGCRFAGAAGPGAFWDRCVAGGLRARPVPPTRFDPEALAPELPPGARLPMRAALVDDVPLDWRTLRIPPIQVEGLHQGEKLALQTIVETIQDAGLPAGPPAPLDRAQVWLAATTFGPDERIDPMRRIRRYRLAAPLREALEVHAPAEAEPALAILDRLVDLASPSIEPDSLFTSASIVAGRATHLCNLRGGHQAVDVGTVSSMAAVAEAAAALERGECELAIVCGVAPLVTASALLAHAHRGELCEGAPVPWDRAARGTVLGEGAFAVALTRAADAQASGKRVYAVIEGIGAAAEPGARDEGALGRCVARASRQALSAAGVTPGAVHAVASRAAGLPSDAAEAAGLLQGYRGRSAPLAVASCVPATGHLRCAGGLAALVQAALAVHRGSWPAPAASARELTGGLVAAGALPFAAGERVAVSDAGPEPVAYHAVLARPGAPAPARPAEPPRPRRRADDGYAVVGIGLVAADANDPETYWKNVLQRSDPVRDLPPSRFDVEALVGKNDELALAFRTRLAATVSPPPFEPARYGVAEAELPTLDPSIPIALLAAEQALRGARWEKGAGRCGQAVFGQLSLRHRDAAVETRVAFAATLALAAEALREVGLSPERIAEVLRAARARFDARGRAHWTEALAASTGWSLTARVAAAFGLEGVPLTVDAACASSLAAVRLACEALARGEVDVALAGGVAYNLLPEYYVGLGLMGALSPRGALPFHPGADGFVPAEGAAAVALRRLADARADGDEILAVIRGHGISSDGRALSIYSPSADGQALAVRRAFEDAGVEPSTVDLLETHGPATQLGDRTEIASCAAVYGGAARPAPLVLSASKSQVGHSTSAAGMIALVRAVLALRERTLPGTNRRGDLDPELHLEQIPAVLPAVHQPWPAPQGHPRRAAVSAFGLAGVNHHLLLEEAPGAAAPAALVATPPATGLSADRFAVELCPVALPARPPLHRLTDERALVVGPAAGPAEALAAALRARGVDARRADPAGVDARSLEGVRLVVDATALAWDPALLDLPAAALAEAARANAQRSVALARSAHEWLEGSAEERPLMYAAVTAMGGDLGLSGSGAGNVLGAFQHGLALALKQELPAVLVKALDAPPAVPAEELAAALVEELEDGNERVQVGRAGRRFVTNLRRAGYPAAGGPSREIRPGDVFLFSGGGRGVVFECARAVARLGAVAVVTGRTPLPDPAAPHVGLDDEGFAELRRREIVRRRGEPGLTPARFEREMAPLVRERELHRNMERARAEGLSIHYEPCDVADPASVRALVERVRARHGAIRFLGHGAMIERSAGLARKTDEDVARTVDAKIAGLLHLLEATADEPVRAVVAFGSGVARFGNRGQTDYAGANALLAALLPARLARTGKAVHCVTVDWPAWREVGWAASNVDIAAGLEAAGVTSILPEEGRYWFLSELLHGAEPEVLLAGERMLHAWPFFGAGADGRRPLGPTDDRAALLVPGAYPLLDQVVERGPGRLTAARRLDAARDPFLAQHLVDGRPVLPGAFALEALAEAAALLSPGAEVVEVTGFHIDAPVVLVRGAVDVRVEVAEVAPGLCEARLTKRLAVEGAPPRVHAAARIRLGARPPLRSAPPIPEGEGVVRARSFYRTSRDPVALGPLFCRAQWLELRAGEAAGTIEPADRGAIVGTSGWPAFQIDPLLLDSAFQLAGSVEGFGEGFVCVPMAVEAVTVGRALRPGESTRGRAVRTREESPRVFYDVTVVGQDGTLVFEVRGLELRRVTQAEAA